MRKKPKKKRSTAPPCCKLEEESRRRNKNKWTRLPHRQVVAGCAADKRSRAHPWRVNEAEHKIYYMANRQTLT